MGIKTHFFGQSLLRGIRGVALTCIQKVTEKVKNQKREPEREVGHIHHSSDVASLHADPHQLDLLSVPCVSSVS